jgi:hypothetical protein
MGAVETLLAVDVRCLMTRQPPLIDQRSPQDRLFRGLDRTAARAGHGVYFPWATGVSWQPDHPSSRAER